MLVPMPPMEAFAPLFLVPFAIISAYPLASLWTRRGRTTFPIALLNGAVLGLLWSAAALVLVKFLEDIFQLGGTLAGSESYSAYVIGGGIPFGLAGAAVFWIAAVKIAARDTIDSAELTPINTGLKIIIVAAVSIAPQILLFRPAVEAGMK